MQHRARAAWLLALPLIGLLGAGLVLAGAGALAGWAGAARGLARLADGQALVAAGLALLLALPTLAFARSWRAALLVPLAAGTETRQAGISLVPMPPTIAAALLVLPVAVAVLWWLEPAWLAADRRAAAQCGAGKLARFARITLPAMVPAACACLAICAALAAGVLARLAP